MDTRAIIGVVDNLTSTSTTDALSANQGRVLKGLVDGLQDDISNIDSSIPLLTGTSSNPIIFSELETGVYIITGIYKATSSNTQSNTSEHIIVDIYQQGSNKFCYTLISPTSVYRKVEIENDEIINNDLFRILNGEFLYNGKNVSCTDTSWKTLTLSSGITEHNTSTYPVRCKKQGNVVYVEGAIKGVTTRTKEVATLPSGYRPSKAQYFVQARTGGKIDTYQISTNGVIEIMNSTSDTFNSSDYHFISTSFMI